jgi:class 3 adenylate cyclase
VPQKITDKLSLRDLIGNTGNLPIPRRRYRALALIRLLVVIPIAVLPTQLFLRQNIQKGWNPEFGTQVVNLHLIALLIYIVANLAAVWSSRNLEKASLKRLRGLNYSSIGCEILTNQAFLVAFGSLDNYSIGFLVLIVVPYRVLFDYRTALGTLLVTMGLFLLFAALELSGTLPAASLYPYVLDHPIRSNPDIWIGVVLYVPVIMMFTFLTVNYAMNQSSRLHTYVTRSVLQRYLPPALVDRAASGELQLDAPPERRVVTVMFTDIVGFTALSERLSPEALGALLNSILGEVATVAKEHGATVDKFIGDCVMVVFGAPEDCPAEEQALRCVKLGQAIHERVNALGAEYQLQARTGLNTGEAVVGNFGSAARSDYTVIGPAVNVAARLESASQPNRILIGPESARLLGDRVALEPAGKLQLKGVSAPVEAWFVADLPA